MLIPPSALLTPLQEGRALPRFPPPSLTGRVFWDSLIVFECQHQLTLYLMQISATIVRLCTRWIQPNGGIKILQRLIQVAFSKVSYATIAIYRCIVWRDRQHMVLFRSISPSSNLFFRSVSHSVQVATIPNRFQYLVRAATLS